MLSTHLLLLEGHINTPDGQIMFSVSQAMLESTTVSIKPLPGFSSFGGPRYQKNGEIVIYSKFGLGMSILSIPPIILGKLLFPFTTHHEAGVFDDYKSRLDKINSQHDQAILFRRNIWYDTSPNNFHEAFLVYVATWTNAGIVAGIGVVLFLLGIRFGAGLIPSLILAIASNFMTPLWHYAGEFFTEPASALGILLFVILCHMSFPGPNPKYSKAGLSGIALGFAVLIKIANALIFPWAAGYALLLMFRHHVPVLKSLKWFFSFGFGLLGPLMIIAYYNFHRFGSILETGYGHEAAQFSTPLLTGLYGLLFSPGRGIVWYSPLFILGVLGFPLFWKRMRPEAIFVSGVFLTFLVFYAYWYMWEGGWCWGPRFLVPTIPLLLLPAALWVVDIWPRSRMTRICITGLALVSMVVAFSAVWVNYNPYDLWLMDTFDSDVKAFVASEHFNYYSIMCFDWRFAPVYRFFIFPVKQEPVLMTSFRYPGLLLGLNLFLAAIWGWSLLRLRNAMLFIGKETR